jgi:F-type H+-transporting ATPase subunit gamma
MSNSRKIHNKIRGVEGIQKITRAMELVAVNKMRKAREKVEKSRLYAKHAGKIIDNALCARMEYPNPHFEKREVKRVGIIIIATDRGLCGGLNVNLFKLAFKAIHEYQTLKIKIDLYLIGAKAKSFFKNLSSDIEIVTTRDLGSDSDPNIDEIINGMDIMVERFNNNKIDEIILFTNKFINAIRQEPIKTEILPISQINKSIKSPKWDYLYEPSAKYTLNALSVRYIDSQIYLSIMENFACEQAARILAMRNATDNADEIINDLKLSYNKLRQTAITQELSEIVSGAAAV